MRKYIILPSLILITICRLVSHKPHLIESASSLKRSSLSASSSMDPNLFGLAKKQSFGLFENIPDVTWERLRHETLGRSLYANPDNPLDNIEDTDRWAKENIKPIFDCPYDSRMGREGVDGEKFVCNPKGLSHSGEPCLVYSFGCAGMYEFEDNLTALLNSTCEIHVFDPAPDFARPGDPEQKNIHYHPWGLISTYEFENKNNIWPKGRGGTFKTLRDIFKELGHENKTIDIFKIDCEGCEWSTYKDWINVGFGQILVETHGIPTPQGVPMNPIHKKWVQIDLNISEFYDAFENNGYALFHKDEHVHARDLSFVKLHDDFWKRSE